MLSNIVVVTFLSLLVIGTRLGKRKYPNQRERITKIRNGIVYIGIVVTSIYLITRFVLPTGLTLRSVSTVIVIIGMSVFMYDTFID